MDWESVVRKPERERSVIRIGAMDVDYGAPLTAGLDRVEDVSFEALPLVELMPAYLAGAYGCALLPPLEALHYVPARLVPGLGIVQCAPAGEVGHESLASTARLIHAERHGGIDGAFEVSGDASTTDLFVEWEALTGLPLVLGVWATSACAPVARLRALLSRAAQDGEAERRAGFEYRLGSDAMESVRVMLRLGVKHGLCPAGVSLRLC